MKHVTLMFEGLLPGSQLLVGARYRCDDVGDIDRVAKGEILVNVTVAGGHVKVLADPKRLRDLLLIRIRRFSKDGESRDLEGIFPHGPRKHSDRKFFVRQAPDSLEERMPPPEATQAERDAFYGVLEEVIKI